MLMKDLVNRLVKWMIVDAINNRLEKQSQKVERNAPRARRRRRGVATHRLPIRDAARTV